MGEPSPRVSIVIPNWNGRSLLAENLPHVLAALASYGSGGEVVVADDASTDDSVHFLAEHFPQVRTILRELNGGFSAACATGIEAAQNNILILLNTDVVPRSDFIAPLVRHFEDEDVFAVSALSTTDDGEPREGAKLSRNRRNIGSIKDVKCVARAIPTLYAVGAHCALRRDYYFALGGFDPLFNPFYCEDLDLCYRAWKHGWRVLFEPQSVVVHEHRDSVIGKAFCQWRTRAIRGRNRVLFHWKNLDAPLTYILEDMRRALYKWLCLEFTFYRARLMACLLLRPLLAERRRVRSLPQMRSDAEVFSVLHGRLELLGPQLGDGTAPRA